MLATAAIVMLTLWVLGLLTNYNAGGLIHVLLLIICVAVLARIMQGKRVF